MTTCHTPETLFELFTLRHEIFYHEHHKIRLESGLDMDDIDFLCDHLSIFDTSSGRLVGSYRLTSSTHSDHFYSSHRFDLRPLRKLPGTKLELGRACIAPEYRRGSVISLLWRGVCEYLQLADARYLFGCASIRSTRAYEAAKIVGWLKANGHYSEDLNINPHPNRAIDLLKVDDNLPFPLPPLFDAYLKAGAKIASLPAIDNQLRCFDFFTLLDIQKLSSRLSRRFGLTTPTDS